MLRLIVLVSCCLVLAAAPPDWPGFRGPNRAGVDDGGALPAKFGHGKNLAWRTNLPPGASSPAIAGDRVFVTAYEGDELLTFAIGRASGNVLWRRAITRQRSERTHELNNAASASPATDGSNVYVFFGDFGLVSYGAGGGERWRLPLGPFRNLHGMASSPMLAGDKVVLICDQDVDAYLLAVQKDSGKAAWRKDRPEVVHGFSTPTLFEPPGAAPQLIVPGSYQLAAYDPATGEKLWWVRGVTWQVKTAAVVDDETVYLSAWAPGADAGSRRFFPPFEEVIAEADSDGDGKLSPEEIPEEMRHPGSWTAIDLDGDGYMDAREWGFYRARWASRNVTLAVRPGNARGDLTETHVEWEYERAVPVVSSPLLYRGKLYTIKDGGILTVFEAASGDVLHQGRVTGAIDKYYASPVAGDGKIYLLSETGKIAVLDADDPARVLAVNDLEEPGYATPAIADGTIFVRTGRALYAFAAE
jgi:outer membrane protein assembly factor BamB